MLVASANVKIPGPAMVSEEIRDVAAMQRHGHHNDFLNGVWVGRKGNILESGGGLRKMVVVVGGGRKRVRNGLSGF